MKMPWARARLRGLAIASVALACATAVEVGPVAIARAETGTAAAAAVEPGLVGTWRLVRFENTAADGTVSHPYGEHPLGYFVYDPTGHLSVQIMRNPPIAPFASSPPSEAELRGAYSAYAAYFGTYRVDKVKRVLHHMVEGATDPRYVAQPDQIRPYRLDGDILIIELRDPKAGTYNYRELHRVK